MNNIRQFPGQAGQSPADDLVNHPAHYNSHPSGVECIDVIENLPCNASNVVKYSWRTGARKATDSNPKAHPINKARWYKEREKVRRVKAMNAALQQFQQTGDAGGLVGQIGSLINTVDLLLEAVIVMGSTKHDLAVAAGLIQDTPPEQLGAPAPTGTATERAWPQGYPIEPNRNPFDHCHTGDECGPKGACGTPGDPGLKTDADLLDTPNGDDRATELPESVQTALDITLREAEDDGLPPGEEIAYDSAKDAAAVPVGYAEAQPNPLVPSPTEDAFVLSWNQLSRAVHNNACQKGFWDNRQQLTAAVNSSCGAGSSESGHVHDLIASQCLALITTEIGEATDALRAGNPYEQGLENVRAVEAELADVVIRIMDTAAAFRWDVAGAIMKKTAFNASRPRMHGGKRF
jgi:NTP pyrophosphatase (non-canonical NTP hydrolase)